MGRKCYVYSPCLSMRLPEDTLHEIDQKKVTHGMRGHIPTIRLLGCVRPHVSAASRYKSINLANLHRVKHSDVAQLEYIVSA